MESLYHSKVFVRLIKLLLDEKGITNYAVAKKLAISKSTVANWFEGTTVPSLDNFLRLAKLAEVNFFFSSKEDGAPLNALFNKAMEQIGRRPEKLNNN